MTDGYAPLYITEVIGMSDSGSSILQGTLDLMVLEAGRKQLQVETDNCERVAGVTGRVLHPETGS
jgi:hypothetical protein